MGRKRKAAIEAATEAPTTAPTEAPTPAPTEAPTAAVTAQEVTQPAKQFQSDPFKQDVISLAEGNDAPKMHLWRSNKFQQMAISFDNPPEEKYREQLEQDGWTYRGREKVWTKQFMSKDEYNAMDEQERAARRGVRQLEAKNLFTDIANSIRADNGMEPVHVIGM